MAELCFSVDDFILDFFSNTAADTASEYDSYGHRRCWTSSGLVPLLLPSAPRQAGRACSASCVLFSYSCKTSFDLMTAESFTHFCWILCTRPALHLLPLVCVLVLVAVRFTLWTMMAELCFSVDDFILDFFSNTTADTAWEYDSYGHRRCWTTAASCPYYSCRHYTKPVGLVLPRVCSRIRAKTASV